MTKQNNDKEIKALLKDFTDNIRKPQSMNSLMGISKPNKSLECRWVRGSSVTHSFNALECTWDKAKWH